MRQGCPLSPYLFLLAVELLAIRVRLCESIRGLYTGPFENKISQYADDTNFPLQPTVHCFKTLVDVGSDLGFENIGSVHCKSS